MSPAAVIAGHANTHGNNVTFTPATIKYGHGHTIPRLSLLPSVITVTAPARLLPAVSMAAKIIAIFTYAAAGY